MGTAKSTPRAAEKAKQLEEYDAWYCEQVQLGIDDADAGRVISDAECRKQIEKHLQGLEKKDGRKAA